MNVVVGFHPVREALRRRPGSVRRVLVSTSRGGARRREIEALCRRLDVALEEVPAARLEGLGVDVHNGVAAEITDSVTARPGGDPDLVVLLEDVQDPRNLGAILRVCEGAGVGRVMIRDRGSAPLSAVAVRASAGASEWVSVERFTNSGRSLEALKNDGFWAYGAAAGGLPPWEIDLTGKLVLCLGGEESGLRARTRQLCDGLVGLPMMGRVGSLNVATAAAALLYEALRQRSA